MQTKFLVFSNRTCPSPVRNLLRCVLLLMFFCLLVTARPAAAQSIQQFVGNVTDSSHAVIVGATVTIHNEDTGEDLVVKTTRAGDYTAPYLKTGVYTVTADKVGFKTLSFTHITLDTDKTSKIDFILSVGSINETVTVSSSGAQIELSKADRGEIIDAERVQEMPTDGRNVLELFELSPGTINTHNPQFTRPQDNVSGNLYANGNGGAIGAPVQENLDGQTNDNAAGFLGYPPPPDSVAEFKVVLNPYDASYGRAGGGAIDISLKSGTNKIHGDMYEYARRPFLDAQSFQYDYNVAIGNKGQIPSRHKRDQFGLEVDGPVVIPHLYDGKDKTFFTLQWEQAYETLPSTSASINSIPNPQWLTGNFTGAQFLYTYQNSGVNPCGTGIIQCLQPLIVYDPLSPLTAVVDPLDGKTKMAHSAFPGNIIPQNRLDPTGLAIAQAYAGITPNYNPGPGYSPYSNNYYWLQVENDISRNGLAKFEHNFGPHDRGSIRWEGFERYDQYNGNGIPEADPGNSISHQLQPKDNNFALDEIHTFTPNLVLDNKVVVLNEKQGYNVTGNVNPNILSQLNFSQHYISNAMYTNIFPSISTSTTSGGTNFIGLGGSPAGFTIVHNLAYQPSVTFVHGRHTIRAGFDMRLYQFATPGGGASNNSFGFSNEFSQHFAPSYSEASGYTSGSSIAALVLGDPNSAGIKYSINAFDSQHYYSIWAQDDWKITTKLTLNLGIRYDLLGPRTERHNQLNYAFDTTDVNPLNAQITNRAGLSGPLLGGIRFAGVNGAPRGSYSTNLLNIQPRFGAAYAFSSRTSLRAGFGEMFINDESNDSSNGFSSSATGYTSTLADNVTPYGHLSDPFSSYVKPTGSSLGLATTVGSSVNFTNPNFQVPSLWEYSVSLQQLLTRNDVVDISYSGTRAYNVEGSYNINAVSAAWQEQCNVLAGGNRQLCDGSGAPAQVASPFYQVPGFAGTTYGTKSTISSGALTRPFPAFTDVTEDHLPLIHTWYNSMQVAVSHNVSKSLTFHYGLTWSKNMTAGAYIDNVYGVRNRVLASNDTPIVQSLSGVFYLPVGRGKALLGNTNHFVDAVVGGWEISPLYVYTQGVPWSPGTNWIPLANSIRVPMHDLQPDSTHSYKRLQAVTPCVAYYDNDTPGLIHYGPTYTSSNCTSPALIRLPQGASNSDSANSNYAPQLNVVYWGVRQPAYHEFSTSLSKRFSYKKVTLQTRLDAFNVLNHPNWTGAGYTNDPTSTNWGTIQKGPQGPGSPVRDLQLSGKLIW
jgi:hypothetical protein